MVSLLKLPARNSPANRFWPCETAQTQPSPLNFWPMETVRCWTRGNFLIGNQKPTQVLLHQFCRSEILSTESLSNLLKITLPVTTDAEIQPQVVWLVFLTIKKTTRSRRNRDSWASRMKLEDFLWQKLKHTEQHSSFIVSTNHLVHN